MTDAARGGRWGSGKVSNPAASPTSAEPVVLTNGKLPLEPFLHMDPTAMALLDLDADLVARPVDESAATTHCRDALVLVRLHSEPLGILYVDQALEDVSEDELARLVWVHYEKEIRCHVSRFGCASLPDGSADLLSGVGGSNVCGLSVSQQPMGSVAVIIPTLGRSSQLRRCLAFLENLTGPECEIIVVNNGPPNPELGLVVDAARSRSARPIRCVDEPRPGSMVARNRGIAETRADIVAFADDDVVVDPDWLRWLVEPFCRPEVGAATGMVLPIELQTPVEKRFEQYAGFSKGVARLSFDLRSGQLERRFLYPFVGGDFGSGASMAFRRDALAARGGFDPALGAGSLALAGGDIEALSATILRGQSLVYEPRALCWHEHRRDDEALRRQIFNYGVGFTAILTKALLHDRRFLGAVARSGPAAVEVAVRRRSRARESVALRLPPEYARLQWRGMLQGPWRYGRSVVWSRRLGLGQVIHGG